MIEYVENIHRGKCNNNFIKTVMFCITVLSIISAPSSFLQLSENKCPFCYIIIKFSSGVVGPVRGHKLNTSSHTSKSSNCLYFL